MPLTLLIDAHLLSIWYQIKGNIPASALFAKVNTFCSILFIDIQILSL